MLAAATQAQAALTALIVAAITSAGLGSIIVTLLSGRFERQRHLREQMLGAASDFATQALTVIAVLRAVKMATPEQIAKGPHRNDVLLQDSEELHHRLEECAAAQKALRAHLGRIRLLFGPTSPASLETDKVIRAVRDMLTTATKYYEKVEENPQDILVLSRKYSSRFVTRREDAWASFNCFCDQAREEMGYRRATSTAEPGGGFTFTVLSS